MAEWWDMYHLNPETLPNYIPGVIYDKAGNPLYTSNAPYGGNAAYGGGGPGVGYGAVGAPNMGGGAGFVGSGYGYTPAGPPVASIGGFGQRGAGINADASMYRGGDFWGGGSGDFAFPGGGGTENIQGTPLADWSLSNFMPGSDPNATMFDGYGGQYAWEQANGQPWSSRGGIGSDAGATGGRYETSYTIDGGASNVWVPNGQGGIGSDAGATGGRWDLAQQIYNGGGIGSDAARAPNDYGSSSYPSPNGQRPAGMNPQQPFTGFGGWPYGPAGGGWGFGRTGSVSDPGANVDLGFGQVYPGYTNPVPGGIGGSNPFGGFNQEGYPGGQMGPEGAYQLNQPDWSAIGQYTHPGGG